MAQTYMLTAPGVPRIQPVGTCVTGWGLLVAPPVCVIAVILKPPQPRTPPLPTHLATVRAPPPPTDAQSPFRSTSLPYLSTTLHTSTAHTPPAAIHQAPTNLLTPVR